MSRGASACAARRYWVFFSFDVERSMFDVHLSKNKNLFSAFEVHNLG